MSKTNLREVDVGSLHGSDLLPFARTGAGISFNGHSSLAATSPITSRSNRRDLIWFHSHSGIQNLAVSYGAIVIELRGHDSHFHADRELCRAG